VDVQPSFLRVIHEAEMVVNRTRFLVKCAHLLGVPVVATEQYPERMGGSEPSLGLSGVVVGKREFGCWANHDFRSAVVLSMRRQVVVVGIESHICVAQTCLEMSEAGFEVQLAVDAVSAREEDQHKVAVKRLRDAGVAVTHTESVVYEWMRSSAHPRFRDVVDVVKREQ